MCSPVGKGIDFTDRFSSLISIKMFCVRSHAGQYVEMFLHVCLYVETCTYM
jgi:hypothetical protein